MAVIRWWAWIAIACMILPVAAAGAETPIREINPVPGPNITNPSAFPPHDAVFHGAGWIFRIDGDQIVIDDQLFRLAKMVVYKKTNGERTTRSDFVQGVHVYFEFDESDKIKALWLHEEQ